jgi:hypothetical protein
MRIVRANNAELVQTRTKVAMQQRGKTVPSLLQRVTTRGALQCSPQFPCAASGCFVCVKVTVNKVYETKLHSLFTLCYMQTEKFRYRDIVKLPI